MGGLGSGRYYRSSSATTVEETKRIDIRYMRRQGLLRPGRSGVLSWTCHGEPSGRINYTSHADRVDLNYRYNGEDETMRLSVPLSFTPCHIGGQRAWFHCPACRRRCEVLCIAGRWPACRKCYRLPYQSQTGDKLDRLQHRQEKLESLLWGDKRKWWRRAKRQRMLAEFERIDNLWYDRFTDKVATLLGPDEVTNILGPSWRGFR